MAGREYKVGLDYFELDCHMEEKVRLIQAEFGLKGFAVVVKLWQKIYGEFGYYCEWSEDSLLLFMSENGVPGDGKNLIKEIVAACIRRDIFSEKLFKDFGILTSSGVQKRYLKATSKREKVELIKEYLLISDGINRKNVVINSIYDGRNTYSEVKNQQSKVEKSREEKNTITVSEETVCQTDVRHIVEKWNALNIYGIAPISKLNSCSKRYKSLVARMKQYGIQDVLSAIDRIKDSDFLQGKNNKGWTITFDWFVLPNNFPKVLEGNYDNRNGGSSNGRTGRNDAEDARDPYARELERMLGG